MSVFIERKKVEIIIETMQIPKIVRLIDKFEIPGYSIIQDVVGRGVHGMRDAQELTDVLNNGYVMVICTDGQAENLATAVAPILKKYGGICFISDVQKIKIG